MTESPECKNLDELMEAMRAKSPLVMDPYDHAQWSTELPTFGGVEPERSYHDGIWSWDEKWVLVGACAAELEIIPR